MGLIFFAFFEKFFVPILTSGGPASFIMPLQIGKTPIVVPRQHQFNEHVNDHQVEFARNVAQRMGTIIPVEDINTLGDIITNYDQIVAGMYRMFFEKDDEQYKKTICSTALCFTIITSLIVFFIMILARNYIAQYFFSDRQYAYVVYLSAMATLVGATNSIIAAPTRMQNKRKVFLVTNTLSPLLSYSISVPMLLAGHYVIALPLAAVISGVTMEVAFGIMNREWFDPRRFDFKLLKELLAIAIPLLPNFLIYWVFNSCDKVMITNMIGIGAAGIYSVGSKLGHASQLIYTAFAGGWQYFAFSTMKDDDQIESAPIYLSNRNDGNLYFDLESGD